MTRFLILILIPIAIGLYAQMRIRNAYNTNLKRNSKNLYTGKDAAIAILNKAEINNVEVVTCPGDLTDHYDPINKKLCLSKNNYYGTSLAAIGVAAHEVGHALQDKESYAPLQLRMSLVPITNFACQFLPLVIFGGFIFPAMGSSLLLIGVFIYLILTIFQLITLPVEFDASKRAKNQLVRLGILHSDELDGVTETLDAAAYTYVAAFVSSLGWFLYLFFQKD